MLLVDTDPARLLAMHDAVAHTCNAELALDFQTARQRLLYEPSPQHLVTNIRLGAYNGLHLVYLARSSKLSMRCVVHGTYDDTTDVALAREVQAAGAFFETSYLLAAALPAMARAALPDADRRDPARTGRRGRFRGGRRSTDRLIPRWSASQERHERHP